MFEAKPKRQIDRILKAFLLLAIFSSPATAQTDLQATMTGVQNNMRMRTDEGQPWQPVQVDMQVGMGAEFRTGLRSAVRFTIPPNQTVTLDRLGVVKVLTAVQMANGKLKTDLGMKYGRTRYKIEAAGLEHDTRIKTPTIALTVRGTGVGVQQDFFGFAWCNTHYAYFNGNGRPEVKFGEPSEVSEYHRRPAEHKMNKDLVDPADRTARTNPESLPPIYHPEGTFDLDLVGINDFRELQELDEGDGTGDFVVVFDLTWEQIAVGPPGDDLNLFVLFDDRLPSDDPLIADDLLNVNLPFEIESNFPPVQNSLVGGVTLAGNGFDAATSQETITLTNPPAGDGIFGVQLFQLGSGAGANNTGITLKVREFLDGVLITDPPAILAQDLRNVGDVEPSVLGVHPINPPN